MRVTDCFGNIRIGMVILFLFTGTLLITGCVSGNTSIPEEETNQEPAGKTTAPSMEGDVVGGTAAPTLTPDTEAEQVYQIITVLPKDAILSVDDPQFYPVQAADEEYGQEEMVIGVVLGGEARAYSITVLSSREIVNDTVGGMPIAVTW